MHACGDPQTSNGPQAKGEDESLPFGFEEAQQTSDSRQVGEGQVDTHGPVDVPFLVMERDCRGDFGNHPCNEAVEDLE